MREHALCSSVHAMVCHPLLAKTGGSDNWAANAWTCKAITPLDAEQYTVSRCLLLNEAAYELSIPNLQRLREESRGQLAEWIASKGLAMEHTACAVVDPRSKRVYPIDMIASRHSKPCLVVVLYTWKRITRPQMTPAIRYASEVHGVCAEQYAMSTTTTVVNVFFKSQAMDDGIGVVGISRPSAVPLPPTRLHHGSPESGVAARRRLPTRDEHT